MTRTSNSGSRSGRRASALTHAVAGFTLTVLAAGVGLLVAGTGLEQAPQSEAAAEAAAVAAFQVAVGGDARPEPQVASRPSGERQPFLGEAGSVIQPRGATRVVVESVGIDSGVRSVGYTFTDGALRYDVPRLEAGQYVGTALPGTPGNTVIGGHVASRGGAAVFAGLPGVNAGDVIQVFRGDQVFRYSVTEIKVVAADATAVMEQTHDATLTLITCFPGEDYQERLVVVGKLL